MEGMAGQKSSLVWAVNIAAFLLVLLWTIPTLGLLVSFARSEPGAKAALKDRRRRRSAGVTAGGGLSRRPR